MEINLGPVGLILPSFMALFVSLWQMYNTRLHNRITLRPYLDYGNISGPEGCSLYIANYGLGPAFITDLKFKTQNKAFRDVREALEISLPPEYRNCQLDTAEITTPSILPSKERLTLFEISRPHEYFSSSDCQAIVDVIHSITIEIKYKSAYEENFKLVIKH